MRVSVVFGYTGNRTDARGVWEKSKSLSKLPNCCILSDIEVRIRAFVCLRIEMLTAKEDFLNALVIRIEAKRLMVDVAAPGERADDESRDPGAYPFFSRRGETTWS